MKLLRRLPLAFLIPAALLLFTALASAVFLRIHISQELREVEQEWQQRVSQALTLTQSMIEHLWQQRQEALMEEQIELMGADGHILFAALVDADDRVVAATRQAWVGAHLADVLPSFSRQPLRQARRSLGGQVELGRDGNSLTAYYPLQLAPNPGEIRPSRVGMLLARYDLAAVKAARRHDVVQHVLSMAFLLLLAALLLGVFFHFVVSRRMRRLVRVAERLADGDFTTRAGFSGGDELARIAGAFDAMAAHVEDYTRALRESEERYRTLVEHSPHVIAVSGGGSWLYANPAARALFTNGGDIVGKPVAGTVHEGDRDAVQARLQAWPQAEEGQGEALRFRLIKPGGGQAVVEGVFSPITFDGHPAVQLVGTDISEQVEMEHTLRRLYRAIEQADEAVAITDSKGTLEYVNPAFTRITGYSAEEAIGQSFSILKSGKQGGEWYKRFWGVILSGEKWQGHLVNRRKDGSEYEDYMTVSPVHNEHGGITHFVAIKRDVTEQLHMEAQLRQAQKMESLGTLVGGIAHDFNNMLAGMSGNLYLAKLKTKSLPEVQDRLDQVNRLCDDAAKMIRQMLAFARKRNVEVKPFPLNLFLKESFKLARSSVPENIEIRSDFAKEEMVVLGDAVQMQQVLMNLLNNARDAIGERQGGVIEVSLQAEDVTPVLRRRHPQIDGARVAHLRLTDNGCGMPKSHVEKIFEPFFTTKPEGFGTGLGLAMVYGAVRAHGGAIEVSSGLNKGSTFDVYLPLSPAPALKGTDTKGAGQALAGKGETILVADDNVDVRQITKGVLESLGYKVIEARDGEEAMELFAHHDGIELAILDVVMPRLGGVEAALRMRELRADLPIVFVTGYDKESAISSAKLERCSVLLKPFMPQELSQRMRELIEGA